ncbi:MAG: o-succinylbenzoate synthase [Raoultibacter sp.]
MRAKFPSLPLMVDANSAYTLNDLPLLQELDQFQLLVIEQPLAADDIIQHAFLQSKLKTAICLDESICSLKDALTAIELKACRIFNLKMARVGGIEESKLIHDIAKEAGIDIWCGGMLEAGIGRAHSVALASLPSITLPGDTAGSSHYFEEDIIKPEVIVTNGQITQSNLPGIGYEINTEAYNKFTEYQKVYR